MSDKMMRVAGRTSNAVAKGIAVTNDGNIEDVRKWHYERQTILNNSEIRDTGTVVVDGGNVEAYGMISLRIRNTLDQPVKIGFYADDATNGGSTTINDLNGYFYVTVPQSTGTIILTANEIPFINYLRYIKLRVVAAAAPTSGALTIMLHKKG